MTRFLKGTDRPLAEAYQLALLDLDGVVYRGKNPVEYAADSIRAAEAAGMTIEYTTNNSSRFQHVVADQLKGFGLDVEPWQVITSSVVAARMVAKALPAGARVQVLGAEHLRDEVTRNGLTIVDGPQDRPQAVIQGWYPDMTWQMMADAAFAVEVNQEIWRFRVRRQNAVSVHDPFCEKAVLENPQIFQNCKHKIFFR